MIFPGRLVMEMITSLLVYGLSLITLSIGLDLTQHLTDDTLPVAPSGVEEHEIWGLKDATAVVGMIFRYEIPAEAFAGSVRVYAVSDADGGALASWLQFNSTSRILEGVPSTSDQNQLSIYHILVSAKLSTDYYVTDTFSIRLTEHSVYTSDAKKLSTDDASEFPDLISCPREASVTSASVVLDADLAKLNASQRVNTLRQLSSYLGLSELAVRYVSVSDSGGAAGIDSSALVAGPGDVVVSNSIQVTGVRWEVGCGSVVPPHMNILQLVESSARDGSLHKATGRGIVGWYVTNEVDPVHPKEKRVKRRARLKVMSTPTLARTVSAPTSRPVPTRFIEPSRLTPQKSEQISRTIQPVKSEAANRTSTTISATPSRIVEATRSTTGLVGTTTSTASTKVAVELIEPSVVTTATTSSSTLTKTQPLPTKSITPAEPRLESSTSQLISATSKSTALPTLPPEPMKPRHVLTVGDILNYSIPQRAFSSFPLHKFLIMNLVLSPGNRPLPKDSWIWYNGIRHVLFGIPEPRDVGKHEYRLTAHDQETNRSETIPFEVIVQRSVSSYILYETYVALDADYAEFMEKLEPKVDVGWSIASLYGDEDLSWMSIVRIEKGSVIYGWTNKSLLRQSENSVELSCPAREINIIMDRVVSEDGAVDPRFVTALEPFRVLYAGGEGRGVCRGVVKTRRGVVKSASRDREPDVQPKTASGDGKRVLVIALAVVALAGLVVLAIAIIVCTKKLHDSNKLLKEEDVQNGTAVKKGVPVILAADLEDRSTNGSTGRGKVTIYGVVGGTHQDDVMRGMKPLPPGYGENSSPAVTRADHRQPLIPVEERYSRSEAQPVLHHSSYKQHRKL